MADACLAQNAEYWYTLLIENMCLVKHGITPFTKDSRYYHSGKPNIHSFFNDISYDIMLNGWMINLETK